MKKTWFEVLGLIFALAYIITFLGVWIIWNLSGYEVVRFTESNAIIKYSEWGMGFYSIFVLLKLLREGFIHVMVVRYDPPV